MPFAALSAPVHSSTWLRGTVGCVWHLPVCPQCRAPRAAAVVVLLCCTVAVSHTPECRHSMHRERVDGAASSAPAHAVHFAGLGSVRDQGVGDDGAAACGTRYRCHASAMPGCCTLDPEPQVLEHDSGHISQSSKVLVIFTWQFGLNPGPRCRPRQAPSVGCLRGDSCRPVSCCLGHSFEVAKAEEVIRATDLKLARPSCKLHCNALSPADAWGRRFGARSCTWSRSCPAGAS